MGSKFRVMGLCGLFAGAAFAQSASDAPESPFHAIARVTGFAITPPPAPDFVRDSRVDAPAGWSPVFKPYDEPASKVKSKDDLKAMGEDLQKTGEASDKLRSDPQPAPSPTATPTAKHAKKIAAPKPTPSPAKQN